MSRPSGPKEPAVRIRRKVIQPFDARLVSSRRRERFGAGELLMLVPDGPETPEHSTFVRINGLRPSRGVESLYIIESEELNQKTELQP